MGRLAGGELESWAAPTIVRLRRSVWHGDGRRGYHGHRTEPYISLIVAPGCPEL